MSTIHFDIEYVQKPGSVPVLMWLVVIILLSLLFLYL